MGELRRSNKLWETTDSLQNSNCIISSLLSGGLNFLYFSVAMGCGWFGSHCWSPAISAGPKLGLHSVHCYTLCAQCLLLVLSLLCIVSTAHSMLVLSLHCPTQCAQCTMLVQSVHCPHSIHCWYYLCWAKVSPQLDQLSPPPTLSPQTSNIPLC